MRRSARFPIQSLKDGILITWWTDIGKAAFFFAFHSVCYLVSQQCLDGKTIPDVVPVEIMHSQAKIKEQL